MKRDDERRWNAADMNFDNKLSLDEYSAFLHPQDYPRMRNVVIEVGDPINLLEWWVIVDSSDK